MTGSTVIFSAPIVGSTTEDRVIVEHDTGNWSVGRVLRADRTKFEREFSFNLGDATQVAMWALSGDPEIATAFNKQGGKLMSASYILMAMAIGAIKTEHAK